MRRWLLHEYPDRYATWAEPRSVGEYEENVDSSERYAVILDAVAALKKGNSSCLPIVFERGRKVDVLYEVREDQQIDAIFQNIDVAHAWLERRAYEHWRYKVLGDPDRYFTVKDLPQDNFPDWITAVVPLSVWEWLRAPAL